MRLVYCFLCVLLFAVPVFCIGVDFNQLEPNIVLDRNNYFFWKASCSPIDSEFQAGDVGVYSIWCCELADCKKVSEQAFVFKVPCPSLQGYVSCFVDKNVGRVQLAFFAKRLEQPTFKEQKVELFQFVPPSSSSNVSIPVSAPSINWWLVVGIILFVVGIVLAIARQWFAFFFLLAGTLLFILALLGVLV